MPSLYDAYGRCRPSGHIRQVLEAPQLTDGLQAQRYLATLSAIVTDGAFDIASEIYHPKDDTFLDLKDTKKIINAVEAAMNRHHLQLNRDRGGMPLVASLPTDVMIRVEQKTYRPATAEEILSVANEVKANTKFLNSRLDRMLAYADAHYAAIDGMLVDGKLHVDQQTNKTPGLPQPRMQPPAPASTAEETATNPLPNSYYAAQKPGLAYAVREQSRHEMFKLYGRSLPSYLWQMPINLAQRMILKKGQNFWDNTKITAYQAAVYPVSESFAGVGAYEATRLNRYGTVTKSEKMGGFLDAAIHTIQETDPGLRSQREKIRQSVLFEEITQRYRDVLTIPPEKRTAKEYRLLAGYFRELHQATESLYRDAYRTMAGTHSEQGFKTHMQDLLTQGAKTPADALSVLSLLHAIRQTADQQILSMEYVDPNDVIVEQDALDRIASHALTLAKQHGLAVEGEFFVENGMRYTVHSNDPSVQSGQLLTRAADGSFHIADGNTLLAYTNALLSYIRSNEGIKLQRLTDITQGHLSSQYMDKLEQTLMRSMPLPQLPGLQQMELVRDGETNITQAQSLLHATLKRAPSRHDYLSALKDHVLRPEALHEMEKLRDRNGMVALFGFPVKQVENLLSEQGFETIRKAFTGSSLQSTAFKAVADTLASSYGAVCAREVTSFNRKLLKDDATQASKLLQGTISSLGQSDPSMKDRFTSTTGLNPLMHDTLLAQEACAAASILTLPPASRSTEQQAVLEQFTRNHGKQLVDSTVLALTGKKSGAGLIQANSDEAALQHLPGQSADSPSEAVMLLASVDALITTESDTLDILRYEGQEQQIIGKEALKELVQHVRDRFYTEGIETRSIDQNQEDAILVEKTSGQPIAGDTLIALANDVAAKALQVMQKKQKSVGKFTQGVINEKLHTSQLTSMQAAL